MKKNTWWFLFLFLFYSNANSYEHVLFDGYGINTLTISSINCMNNNYKFLSYRNLIFNVINNGKLIFDNGFSIRKNSKWACTTIGEYNELIIIELPNNKNKNNAYILRNDNLYTLKCDLDFIGDTPNFICKNEQTTYEKLNTINFNFFDFSK